MTHLTVDPHLYSGYGMKARFASHMPRILTVVTEKRPESLTQREWRVHGGLKEKPTLWMVSLLPQRRLCPPKRTL
ncbi:hypothetical protein TNCV_1488971 [Trichonephila clavipes]|nr:hypothetical protein TNCV_1488971 [Trichonephila clavipes]